MIDAWKRVLVLAPHTDDGEFGCGGTMARLVDAGAEVRYVAFSIATKSLPAGFPPDTLAREVREATAAIGIPETNLTVHDFEVRTFPEHRQEILELLIALWEEWRPDVVHARLQHGVRLPLLPERDQQLEDLLAMLRKRPHLEVVHGEARFGDAELSRRVAHLARERVRRKSVR